VRQESYNRRLTQARFAFEIAAFERFTPFRPFLLIRNQALSDRFNLGVILIQQTSGQVVGAINHHLLPTEFRLEPLQQANIGRGNHQFTA
jgi:hypothetical protein